MSSHEISRREFLEYGRDLFAAGLLAPSLLQKKRYKADFIENNWLNEAERVKSSEFYGTADEIRAKYASLTEKLTPEINRAYEQINNLAQKLQSDSDFIKSNFALKEAYKLDRAIQNIRLLYYSKDGSTYISFNSRLRDDGKAVPQSITNFRTNLILDGKHKIEYSFSGLREDVEYDLEGLVREDSVRKSVSVYLWNNNIDEIDPLGFRKKLLDGLRNQQIHFDKDFEFKEMPTGRVTSSLTK